MDFAPHVQRPGPEVGRQRHGRHGGGHGAELQVGARGGAS